MRIQVIQAGPCMHEVRWLELADGAVVADAVMACGFDYRGIAGLAVFGQRVDESHRLGEGDRLELLRPLASDPKDTRRKRARRAGK